MKLKCTRCSIEVFSVGMEFTICAACGVGFLLEVTESSIDEKMNRISKMNRPDDMFDFGYEDGRNKYGCEFYTPDPQEVVRELHGDEPPDINNFDAGHAKGYGDGWSDAKELLAPWNLQLSADDIDSQRFTTCTIDDTEPEEITTEVINKMQEIFTNTFGNTFGEDSK